MKTKECKKKNKKSLEGKLTKLLIGAILIPSLLLGGVAFVIFNGISEKSFEEKSLNQKNSTETIFYTEIGNVMKTIDAVAFDIINNEKVDKEGLKSSLRIVTDGNKTVKNIYYLSDQNELTIYPEADLDENEDFRKKQWYESAKETLGVHVTSDVYVDSISGEKMITVSKGVSRDGSLLGVVAIDMSLKNIESILVNTNKDSMSDMAVIDGNGMLIAYTGVDAWDNSFVSFKDAENGISEFEELGKKYLCSISRIEKSNWKVINTTEKSVLELSRNIFLIFLLGSLLLLVPIGYLISKRIFKKISIAVNEIKDGVKLAATGDLKSKVHIKTNDELEELSNDFNVMKNNIGKLVGSVENGINKVENAAIYLSGSAERSSVGMAEISSTIGEISKGTSTSSENLVTLSGDMEKVSKEINNISESIYKMEEITKDTMKKGENGVKLVGVVIEKTNEVKGATEKVSEEVNRVAISVDKISKINETIAQITNQTNLLALNAAIEAARAGESGRGFAVVADEIRKLATETSTSASEIGEIISEIKINVNKAVTEVEESKRHVDMQRDGVEQSVDMFKEIRVALNNIVSMGSNIAGAVQTMSENKDSIVKGIESNSAILEENAAGTQQVDASCQEVALSAGELTTYVTELNELALKLKKEIEKFNI